MQLEALTGNNRPQTRREKLDCLLQLFACYGARSYAEEVSQLEHMLQSASFAQRKGAPDHVVLAALFHDIGHFLDERSEFIADEGVDTRHERRGARFLRRFFDRKITGPIALHVAAKRYLASCEPGYLKRLSAASVKSLRLQGGPFTPIQAANFRDSPYFADAILVRQCDDAGKQVGLAVPPLSHYEQLILDHLMDS